MRDNDDEYSLVSSRKGKDTPMEVVANSATPAPMSDANTNLANNLIKIGGKLPPSKFEKCVEAYKTCSENMDKFYTDRFKSAQASLQKIVDAQTQIQNAQIQGDIQIVISNDGLEAKRVEAEKDVKLAEEESNKYKMKHDEIMAILSVSGLSYQTTQEKFFQQIDMYCNQLNDLYSLMLKAKRDSDRKYFKDLYSTFSSELRKATNEMTSIFLDFIRILNNMRSPNK